MEEFMDIVWANFFTIWFWGIFVVAALQGLLRKDIWIGDTMSNIIVYSLFWPMVPVVGAVLLAISSVLVLFIIIPAQLGQGVRDVRRKRKYG